MIYLLFTAFFICYLLIGMAIFKIDIDHGSVILTPYCFENAGFELYFLMHATIWPVLLLIMLFRLPKLIKTNKKQVI